MFNLAIQLEETNPDGSGMNKVSLVRWRGFAIRAHLREQAKQIKKSYIKKDIASPAGARNAIRRSQSFRVPTKVLRSMVNYDKRNRMKPKLRLGGAKLPLRRNFCCA